MVASILDKLIKKIYPLDANLSPLDYNIHSYAALLEKFASLVFKIQVNEHMQNLDALNFWIDLTLIVAKNGGQDKDFLIECADLAVQIENEEIEEDKKNDGEEEEYEPQSFLENPEFA